MSADLVGWLSDGLDVWLSAGLVGWLLAGLVYWFSAGLLGWLLAGLVGWFVVWSGYSSVIFHMDGLRQK